MSDQQRQPQQAAGTPMLSVSFDPAEGLLRMRALDPPVRPGLVANLERFEILSILGLGGMGVVLLARDPGSSARVAIKLLRPELAQEPRAVHRFLVEARRMQRFSHPNILPVLEVSERAEGPYYVMPYMDRGSLAKLIRPSEPLDHGTALQIAREIGAGLEHAHSKGLIHGDIKPANVLMDAAGRAYLTDFGLARRVYNDSLLDVERAQCEGTTAYMSPGVAAGQAEDARRDIYSFGATLYEMLTGRPPYEDASQQEILNQILAGPPSPILKWNPKADPGLTRIAGWAMARELRDRYAQMADVNADLERAAKGQEPLGPRGREGSKWRAAAGRMTLPAAVAAVLVILSAVTWWLWPSEPTAIYVSYRDKILVTDPEGKTWRELPVRGTWIDVSPDGSRICYARQEADVYAVFVSKVDGTDEDLVVRNGTNPRWIDDHTIIYSLWKPGPSMFSSVWKVDLDSNKAQELFDWKRVTAGGYGGFIVLSPDRTHLLTNAQNKIGKEAWSPGQDLYTCDLQGNDLRVVWADQTNDVCDTAQFWLPGDRFVWCRYARPGAYVWDHAIVTKGPHDAQYRALTDWDGHKYPIAASPDGKQILFIRSLESFPDNSQDTLGTPEMEMWIMNADGSGARKFTDRKFFGLWPVNAAWGRVKAFPAATQGK